MSFLATFQTFDADTEETALTQEHFLSIADVSRKLLQLYTIHIVHTCIYIIYDNPLRCMYMFIH